MLHYTYTTYLVTYLLADEKPADQLHSSFANYLYKHVDVFLFTGST